MPHPPHAFYSLLLLLSVIAALIVSKRRHERDENRAIARYLRTLEETER